MGQWPGNTPDFIEAYIILTSRVCVPTLSLCTHSNDGSGHYACVGGLFAGITQFSKANETITAKPGRYKSRENVSPSHLEAKARQQKAS